MIPVQIVRRVEEGQPDIAECVLTDAFGRPWSFIDQLPLFTAFTAEDLNARSSYPRPGVIACVIVRAWIDGVGRDRCIIDTARAWGIESTNGQTQFEIFTDLITTKPTQLGLWGAQNLNLSIIRAFIADQRTAKNLLHEKLGVAPDIPAMDWVKDQPRVIRQYEANPFADKFSPHGYGVELAARDLYIDFDYSREGRPDGFDAWRLYVYLMAGDCNNSGADGQIYDRVLAWVEHLALQGRIEKLDNLYYLK